MSLKLTKPLVFFDIESTGKNVVTDRIVELSVLKLNPDQSKETKTWLVNPQCDIPKEAYDIHGIDNQKVKDAPTFRQIAGDVNAMIKGCDLAGFNSNRFDIPLLAEEMLRNDQDFSMKNRLAVDVQVIFHKKEQRTLSAGYQFYCGKSLENAHSAEADTLATYEILMAQIEKYEDIGNDVKTLSAFSRHSNAVDFSGHIVLDDKGFETFNFGKYRGRRVSDVLDENPGYYAWMQQADFPEYTKKILTGIRLKKMKI